MASGCLHAYTKKKVSSSNVISTTAPVKTVTKTGAKDDNAQNKEDSNIKSDTLAIGGVTKESTKEYPETIDTLKVISSGYFLLKKEVETMKREVDSLKKEVGIFKEDTNALKSEIETLKKEKGTEK